MILSPPLFLFFFQCWGGWEWKIEAVVSLIPENLFCRKTRRCVPDGEGVAALMTQPAVHIAGREGNEGWQSPFSDLPSLSAHTHLQPRIKEASCCLGPRSVTCEELLLSEEHSAYAAGMAPCGLLCHFPPHGTCSAVVKKGSVLVQKWAAAGDFGVSQWDACS